MLVCLRRSVCILQTLRLKQTSIINQSYLFAKQKDTDLAHTAFFVTYDCTLGRCETQMNKHIMLITTI